MWSAYTYFTVRFGAVVSFLRFKLSCHDLGIELGRWKHRVARQDRLCTYCDGANLDDEMHMIFECPEMQVVREQYSHLFSGSANMADFFAQDDQIAVMKFVLACLDARQDNDMSDEP